MNRLVLGSVVSVGLMLGGAATASAQESQEPAEPGSVTITLSPEQVANLCEKRLPRIEKRTTRLVEKINGDASVRGSADWLRARAAKERDAGRETTAQTLEERADRRAGHVDKLNEIKQWATDFQTEHCGAK